MEIFALELRQAVRSLARRPAFASTAALTLALGVGATTMMWSVVQGVLLRPLPLHEPDRLVWLWSTQPAADAPLLRSSEANVVDWRERQTRFAGLAGAKNRAVAWSDPDESVTLSTVVTTHDFFDVLGAPAFLGRTFQKDDVDAAHPAVLLSHNFWRTHFDGDGALGTTMHLDGVAHTVVGVLPSDFAIPRSSAEIYLTRRFVGGDIRRSLRSMWSVARLAPGVDVADAQAEMSRIAAELAEEHPKVNQGWDIAVTPLQEHIVRHARGPVTLLFATVAMVLLIACANVANLFLVRTDGRAAEIAVRRALGAGRRRLMARVVLESILVALAGGLLGVAFAQAALPVVLALAPDTLPRMPEIRLDGGALFFALAATTATALAFASLPAWGTVFRAPSQGLLASRGVRSGHRVQRSLVVVQTAVALVLVAIAGLLLQTFLDRTATPLGFDAERLAVVRVFTQPGRLRGEARTTFFRTLEDRLATVPGVAAVGGATKIPLSGIGLDLDSAYLRRDDVAERLGDAPEASVKGVTPGFLAALGVPVLQGRGLLESDRAGAADVVVVSRRLAEEAWPGQDAIGQSIRLRHGGWRPREVVGVIGDVRWDGLQGTPPPTIFFPIEQHEVWNGLTFLVRTHGLPEPLLPVLHRAVLDAAPDQPPHSTTTMATLRREALGHERFSSLLSSCFAFLALALAAVGIYAVIAALVQRSTPAIGVRLALGAQRRQVFGLVLAQSLLPVAIGVALGLAATAGGLRLLVSLDVAPERLAPAPLIVATISVAAAAFAASYLPARSATRVDPVEVLRHE